MQNTRQANVAPPSVDVATVATETLQAIDTRHGYSAMSVYGRLVKSWTNWMLGISDKKPGFPRTFQGRRAEIIELISDIIGRGLVPDVVIARVCWPEEAEALLATAG